MDVFEAPISEQIQYCEDAIECLKSRINFFRRRLRKLHALSEECPVEPVTFNKESDNG